MKNILSRKNETYQSPVAEVMDMVSAEVLCSSPSGQLEDYNILDVQEW